MGLLSVHVAWLPASCRRMRYSSPSCSPRPLHPKMGMMKGKVPLGAADSCWKCMEEDLMQKEDDGSDRKLGATDLQGHDKMPRQGNHQANLETQHSRRCQFMQLEERRRKLNNTCTEYTGCTSPKVLLACQEIEEGYPAHTAEQMSLKKENRRQKRRSTSENNFWLRVHMQECLRDSKSSRFSGLTGGACRYIVLSCQRPRSCAKEEREKEQFV